MDNKTVFSNYTELALAGKFIHVPGLVGNNNYEQGLFELIAAGSGFSATAAQWDGFTAGEFTCPAYAAAGLRVKQGLPTWRYRYFGLFPNLEIATASETDQAYHTAELLPLFGTSQESTKTDSTWQERAMGDYLRGAWAAFAACPATGLINYGWPTFALDNNTDTLVGLGMGAQGYGLTLLPSLAYDDLCGPVSMPSMYCEHIMTDGHTVPISRHAEQLSAGRYHDAYDFQAETHDPRIGGRQSGAGSCGSKYIHVSNVPLLARPRCLHALWGHFQPRPWQKHGWISQERSA